MRGRTCSSTGGSSWAIGPSTSPARTDDAPPSDTVLLGLSSVSVTIDQIVMAGLTAIIVVLTAIIAASAIAQALFIRNQLEILRTTKSREEHVNVVVQTCGQSFQRIAGDHAKQIDFVGFQVINCSLFAVTINSWQLESEQPENRRGSGHRTRPVFREVVEYEGSTLTTLKTPHQLEHGGMATVMMSEAEVLSDLRRDDGTVTRVRGVFHDTLGNAHRVPYWVEWTERGIANYDCPAPGYITPEETRRS